MTEVKPNVPLLRRTLAHIEANPLTWDQSWWRCETGMCFAGWACELAGGEWLVSAADMIEGAASSADMVYLIAEPGDDEEVVLPHVNGMSVVTVHARALRVLGLDEEQAEHLFSTHNSIVHLRDLVAELTEGAQA